ncbi:hypothetical protein NQ314_015714 [Rhamnusium bicolor]|uniref:Uncharacterized protein n=1 Tax=Rhamnusium bicolor TaxID=1586634 RepID=A0AAV8WY72_9CUCU|nr:hypothetical protein NQ314_015714 [Rhamnusium bicolor]
MRQVIFSLALVGFAACARLDYLPPVQGSRSFSGSGAFPGSGAFSGSGATSGSGSGAFPGAGVAAGAGAGAGSGAFSGSGRQIPILRFDDKNDGEGSYSYAYETGNGISAQEQGDARGDGTKAHGGFSYTSPDGQQVHIQYTADENGFQAQGSHIPTPPPIPEEIQRAIQQNLADEARGIVDDGQYRDDSSGQYRADSSGQYRSGSSGQFGGTSFSQGQGGGYRY